MKGARRGAEGVIAVIAFVRVRPCGFGAGRSVRVGPRLPRPCRFVNAHASMSMR